MVISVLQSSLYYHFTTILQNLDFTKLIQTTEIDFTKIIQTTEIDFSKLIQTTEIDITKASPLQDMSPIFTLF